MSETLVYGRNAVNEALSAGNSINKVFIIEGNDDILLKRIVSKAKNLKIVVKYVSNEKMDQLSNKAAHQGAICFMSAANYVSIEEMLEDAKAKDQPPFIIILDKLEDPHNLGAVIRTANQVGAHGVIIPKHHAVGLTEVVAKTSAGAVFHTKVAQVTNLVNTIEQLKKAGLWIYCADMDGQLMYNVDLKGAVGLVIGSEGDGVSRLVKEKCDGVIQIPMYGQVDSLNASVAASVVMYEVLRQNKFSK